MAFVTCNLHVELFQVAVADDSGDRQSEKFAWGSMLSRNFLILNHYNWRVMFWNRIQKKQFYVVQRAVL